MNNNPKITFKNLIKRRRRKKEQKEKKKKKNRSAELKINPQWHHLIQLSFILRLQRAVNDGQGVETDT